MKKYICKYKDKIWKIETVFYKEDNNARIRIGRTDDNNNYEWELVFESDLEMIQPVEAK